MPGYWSPFGGGGLGATLRHVSPGLELGGLVSCKLAERLCRERTSNQPGWLDRCNCLVLSCLVWPLAAASAPGKHRLQHRGGWLIPASSLLLGPGGQEHTAVPLQVAGSAPRAYERQQAAQAYSSRWGGSQAARWPSKWTCGRARRPQCKRAACTWPASLTLTNCRAAIQARCCRHLKTRWLFLKAIMSPPSSCGAASQTIATTWPCRLICAKRPGADSTQHTCCAPAVVPHWSAPAGDLQVVQHCLKPSQLPMKSCILLARAPAQWPWGRGAARRDLLPPQVGRWAGRCSAATAMRPRAMRWAGSWPWRSIGRESVSVCHKGRAVLVAPPAGTRRSDRRVPAKLAAVGCG